MVYLYEERKSTQENVWTIVFLYGLVFQTSVNLCEKMRISTFVYEFCFLFSFCSVVAFNSSLHITLFHNPIPILISAIRSDVFFFVNFILGENQFMREIYKGP